MKVVDIRKCRGGNDDLVRLTSYLFKAVTGGKTEWMSKQFDDAGALTDASSRLTNCEGNKRNIVFSRLAEILSHTDIRQLIISGGEGHVLKKQLSKTLIEYNKLHATPAPDDFGVKRTLSFWRAMRKHGHGKKYNPPMVT